MSYKILISHSSTDKDYAVQFVHLLFHIGLKESDIICSSVPETKIPFGKDIYEYLEQYISDDTLIVFYFLSDNYYRSAAALNEMGATWIRKNKSYSILLPGFDFEDMRGVVNKNSVAIKLGVNDQMTRASMDELFTMLKDKFSIRPSSSRWENARDDFLSFTLETERFFNMNFSRGYCIGQFDEDGCRIVKSKTDASTIYAEIDFNKTKSKLCSIVVFPESRDFRTFYQNRGLLYFDAYSSVPVYNAEVEMRVSGIDVKYSIDFHSDLTQYSIPLESFCQASDFWKDVSEIKFLFHRKYFKEQSIKSVGVTIKNLHIK